MAGGRPLPVSQEETSKMKKKMSTRMTSLPHTVQGAGVAEQAAAGQQGKQEAKAQKHTLMETGHIQGLDQGQTDRDNTLFPVNAAIAVHVVQLEVPSQLVLHLPPHDQAESRNVLHEIHVAILPSREQVSVSDKALASGSSPRSPKNCLNSCRVSCPEGHSIMNFLYQRCISTVCMSFTGQPLEFPITVDRVSVAGGADLHRDSTACPTPPFQVLI
ncbi:hypothetical protein JZ751_009007 [Albula glossodonta]|uniref:Uncharacterized protein n=1 Tax=Albula glossodonta TaxID=121402 RepID=A0A8T2P3F0_9TELE|nr:hypothetical protein JZ751_009007 [Albula glossodonta]